MPAREVVREVTVTRAVALEWDIGYFQSQLFGALNVPSEFLETAPAIGTSAIRSAITLHHMHERLRGIASQRAAERSLFNSGEPS